MNKPLVSVIVPIYNVEEYLEACLNSIVEQKYKNIEAICINDGSTDGSSKILDTFKENSNITIVHQENQGVSVARNTGIELATGKFITFVDADDIITKDYISNLMSMMDDSVDVAMCDFKQIKENAQTVDIVSSKQHIEVNDINSSQALSEILYGTVLDSGPFCKLYRSSLIGNIHYDKSIKIGEDLEFICRILMYKKLNIRYTTQRLYGYRIRQGSAMTDKYTSKYYEYFTLVTVLRDRLTPVYPEILPAFKYRLFGIASFGIGKMGKSYIKFIDDYEDYNRTLKLYSRIIITNSRSGKRNRLLALGYIVSARLTSWVRCNIV